MTSDRRKGEESRAKRREKIWENEFERAKWTNAHGEERIWKVNIKIEREGTKEEEEDGLDGGIAEGEKGEGEEGELEAEEILEVPLAPIDLKVKIIVKINV